MTWNEDTVFIVTTNLWWISFVLMILCFVWFIPWIESNTIGFYWTYVSGIVLGIVIGFKLAITKKYEELEE